MFCHSLALTPNFPQPAEQFFPRQRVPCTPAFPRSLFTVNHQQGKFFEYQEQQLERVLTQGLTPYEERSPVTPEEFVETLLSGSEGSDVSDDDQRVNAALPVPQNFKLQLLFQENKHCFPTTRNHSFMAAPMFALPSKPSEPKRQKCSEHFWTTLKHEPQINHFQKAKVSVPVNRIKSDTIGRTPMECFTAERVGDFKHLIYNLLVENYNHPDKETFVQPCTILENGEQREGFRFDENDNPEKKLPILYAKHVRKANLQSEDQGSIFIQDLYKFYLRASLELLSKYFEKQDRFTFLYDDIPLFVPGGALEEAEERITKMSTRQRKGKRKAKH